MAVPMITPRGNEIDAVLSTMHAGDYDTPKKMAQQIVKAVYAELLERDWFIYSTRFASSARPILFGPIHSESAVLKLHARLGFGEDMRCSASKLYSLGQLTRQVDQWPAPTDFDALLRAAAEQIIAEQDAVVTP